MDAPAVPVDTIFRRHELTIPRDRSSVWLIALIGVLALMHLSMVFGRAANWDEFWFYSQVELVARGEFIQPLQTIHTRFFAWWLPATPGSELDHILIARLFMLGFLAITSTSIFLVAEKFTDRRTAAVAVLAYLGAGFVLQHGTAFRVDPIVTACLASSFAIIARSRLSLLAIVSVGVLIGLAAMVTIKMVLWTPAFAGLALWRWEEEGFDWRYPLRWVAAGVVALATFALLYSLHSSGMGVEASQQAAAGTLGRSAEKMFSIADSYRLTMIGKAVAFALPLFLMAAFLPLAVFTSGWTRARKIAALAIWAVVLTPLFYHNSYAYFYAFILPPVAMISVFAAHIALRRYGVAVVTGAIAASALLVWIVDPRDVLERQKVLVEGVHEAFPEPVAYFDCCGMIGSFDKANIFRTSWGIQRYLDAGRPLMLETMKNRPVPLLIDNKREFAGALDGSVTGTFHDDDLAALRTSYVPLWGDVFVAGRDLAPGEAQSWDVLVPGEYSVTGTIEIDGKALASGATVQLPRGKVLIANRSGEAARLIWGKDTRQPSAPFPEFYWTAF